MTRIDWKKRSLRLWILAAFLRGMTWLGIRADLLVIVREGEYPVEIDQPAASYDFRFLSQADIEQLVRLEPDVDKEQLETWFDEGKLCYGVWDGSRLIAKMWCDPHEFYHPTNPYKLGADEVYLFLAYVDPDYRGQGLAPQMRAAGYAALRENGRRRFYSYSRFFNTAARRFKAKLGAREEGLRIHFRFFGTWSRSLTFRWSDQTSRLSG